MNYKEAFALVFQKLKEVPMFCGYYDAFNGNKHFMNGVSSVMEFIAYQISDEIGADFTDEFLSNMMKSER